MTDELTIGEIKIYAILKGCLSAEQMRGFFFCLAGLGILNQTTAAKILVGDFHKLEQEVIGLGRAERLLLQNRLHTKITARIPQQTTN